MLVRSMKLCEIEQQFPKALPYDIKVELRQQGVLPPRSTSHRQHESCPIEVASMSPGAPADRLHRLTQSTWADPSQLHSAVQTDINELGDLVLAYAENNRLYKVVRDLKQDVIAAEDRIRADLEMRSGESHITLRTYYLVKLEEARAQADAEIRTAADRSRVAIENVRKECDQRVAVLEDILQTRIFRQQCSDSAVVDADGISKLLLAFCVQQEITLALKRQEYEQLKQSIRKDCEEKSKQPDLNIEKMQKENQDLCEEIRALQALLEVHLQREKDALQRKDDEINALQVHVAETESQLLSAKNEVTRSSVALSDAETAFRIEADDIRAAKQAEIALLDGIIKSKDAEIGRLKADKTAAALANATTKRRRQSVSGSKQQRRQSFQQDDLEAFLLRNNSPKPIPNSMESLQVNMISPRRQKGRSNTAILPDSVPEALGKLNSWHVDKRSIG